MGRIYNFSAGPATLPEAVLKEAAEEMLDYIWKIVIIIGNHVITLMVKPAVNLIKVLNEAPFDIYRQMREQSQSGQHYHGGIDRGEMGFPH